VADPLSIAVVVEDELSLAVVSRVVAESGRPFEVTRRLVERGFGNIKRSVLKYRQASHVIPHVVLTDLDRATCPAALRAEWDMADLPSSMLFRVAVRETESWVLGDRHGFAEFAAVALNKIPQDPEALEYPKEALIALVRRSRKRRLIQEMVPPHGSSVPIGPLYNDRLCSFVEQSWDIDAAAGVCPSLRRMRHRLGGFLL
jgi:hypothetical protein